MQAWVNHMAPYVKSLDKNHLLTVGEEGFYSTTADRLDCNPLFDSGEYCRRSGNKCLETHTPCQLLLPGVLDVWEGLLVAHLKTMRRVPDPCPLLQQCFCKGLVWC